MYSVHKEVTKTVKRKWNKSTENECNELKNWKQKNGKGNCGERSGSKGEINTIKLTEQRRRTITVKNSIKLEPVQSDIENWQHICRTNKTMGKKISIGQS